MREPSSIIIDETHETSDAQLERALVHWRCPDCRQPCTCPPDIAAFNLPHERCGIQPGSRL